MSMLSINGLWITPILANATVTASATYGPFTSPYVVESAIIAISVNSVSGTSPSLTVTFNAYDPYAYDDYVENTTTITAPPYPYYTASSSAITAAGGYNIPISIPYNFYTVQLTVSGTSPSFGGVFISVIERVS